MENPSHTIITDEQKVKSELLQSSFQYLQGKEGWTRRFMDFFILSVWPSSGKQYQMAYLRKQKKRWAKHMQGALKNRVREDGFSLSVYLNQHWMPGIVRAFYDCLSFTKTFKSIANHSQDFPSQDSFCELDAIQSSGFLKDVFMPAAKFIMMSDNSTSDNPNAYLYNAVKQKYTESTDDWQIVDLGNQPGTTSA